MSEKSFKVLSVCNSLCGGAGRAAYRIHQSVRYYGVDSRMLLKSGKSSDPNIITLDEFVPKNSIYKAFDWSRNKVINKRQHIQWNRYPILEQVFMSDLRGTDLHGALKKLDYDVLHLHWINNRFVSIDDLPKDKPIIWTLHDGWPFCGICHYFFECEGYKSRCGCCPFLHSNQQNDLSYQILKRKAEVYKSLNLHIVTPSRWLGECAKQSSLMGRFPVTVIPNCLDAEEFHPLKNNELSKRWLHYQEDNTTKRYVLFGAMKATTDRMKGFDYLLSALRLLDRLEKDNDFELIVFGAEQSDLEIDVKFPVHFVGYVDNVQELLSLYSLASVMVVPSLTENLSCTIMESLSCATPVVAFDVGGNRDMIEHGINGYLAREKDSEDLAKGILWCLSNNTDNRLGIAGREKVIKQYSPETVARQYLSLYESVLR